MGVARGIISVGDGRAAGYSCADPEREGEQPDTPDVDPGWVR